MTKHSAVRAAVALAVLAGMAAALSRRFIPVKVEGPSMLPTLRPGDRLLVDRRRAPRAGDIAVVRRPDGIEIVKRVGETLAESLWLLGDHQASSTDSREIGPLRKDAVLGVVLARYAPLRMFRFRRGLKPARN